MKDPSWRTATASLTRFLRRESGTATVEIVLWVPVLMATFGLVVDTAMVFGGRSQILRVVQDTNRAVSVGHITTVATAESTILTAIQDVAPNATADTTIVSGVINSVVTIPIGDLTATGLVSAFEGFTVTVSAQHLAEN